LRNLRTAATAPTGRGTAPARLPVICKPRLEQSYSVEGEADGTLTKSRRHARRLRNRSSRRWQANQLMSVCFWPASGLLTDGRSSIPLRTLAARVEQVRWIFA